MVSGSVSNRGLLDEKFQGEVCLCRARPRSGICEDKPRSKVERAADPNCYLIRSYEAYVLVLYYREVLRRNNCDT